MEENGPSDKDKKNAKNKANYQPVDTQRPLAKDNQEEEELEEEGEEEMEEEMEEDNE